MTEKMDQLAALNHKWPLDAVSYGHRSKEFKSYQLMRKM